METCLVTTLKEAVTDTSLLKLGEMKLHKVANTDVVALQIYTYEGITLRVTNPGYFTDATGTSNLGQSQAIGTGATTIYLPASGEFDLIIPSKYSVANFGAVDYRNGNLYATSGALYIDLEDIRSNTHLGLIRWSAATAEGTFSDFDNSPNMYSLSITGDGHIEKFTGDISALTGKPLSYVALGINKKITGNISAFSGMTNLATLNLYCCYNLTGNISSIASNPLVSLILTNISGVTGNLSSLASTTTLKTLNISGTGITGDTSSLANLTELTVFNYANTAITGTWPLT